MRKLPPPARSRKLASVFGLVTASVACLCGGTLVAAAHEGLARLAFAGGGFLGYLYFFAHALQEIALPKVLIDERPDPDGEVRRGDSHGKARAAGRRDRTIVGAMVATVLILEGRRANAQAPPPETPAASTPAASAVQLHGLVDVYASWNPNRPFDHANFEPGTGTTAANANELGLNLAALDVSLDANPVGFHVVAVAGTGTDVVHAAELHPDTWRPIYQASVSYRLDAGRGVLFELGIQPSHIGYEGFFSKDNWSYTRGWMGEFSPYYQTGLKVATSFDDRWSGQLWLLNGWQTVENVSGGAAYGTQVAYAKDALGVTWNLFAGPVLPDDDAHWRTFSDFVATLKISSKVQLAASLDLGEQRRPGLEPARWQGASVWLRYLLRDSSAPPSSSSPNSPSSALALRVEYFHDPDAAVSPVSQSLFGTTLTFEIRPHPQLILKLEGRYDRSTAEAFGGPDGPLTKKDEFLLVLGAVATF